MGVYNEQGASLQAPAPQHQLIKESDGGSARPHYRTTPPLGKDPPKVVPDNKMFVVGGWTRDDPSCPVEQFCPEYNEWRSAAGLVERRGSVGVASLHGQIYAVGGEDAVRCYSSAERYSPDTDSWSTDVAPLSSPRSGVCLVAMDGYLHAIGGHDGLTAMDTVERYDPEMNVWRKQAPMTTRRTRAAAAVLDGRLYVMGGSDGATALSSVERYDPLDGTWSVCGHMLSPRDGAGCTVHLGQVYVAGGRDELGLVLSTAERLHPDTMRWTPVKHMRSKRAGMSLVDFNGSLLAVGGADDITSLKTIEVYNHETNTWRHFGSMKSKHPGGRAAALR